MKRETVAARVWHSRGAERNTHRRALAATVVLEEGAIFLCELAELSGAKQAQAERSPSVRARHPAQEPNRSLRIVFEGDVLPRTSRSEGRVYRSASGVRTLLHGSSLAKAVQPERKRAPLSKILRGKVRRAARGA